MTGYHVPTRPEEKLKGASKNSLFFRGRL